MKQTMPKNDRPVALESRAERRTAIVPAIGNTLANLIDAITSFSGNLKRGKHLKEDIRSTFEIADHPVIAIAKHKAFLSSQSFVTRARPDNDVCGILFERDWRRYLKEEAAADRVEANGCVPSSMCEREEH